MGCLIRIILITALILTVVGLVAFETINEFFIWISDIQGYSKVKGSFLTTTHNWVMFTRTIPVLFAIYSFMKFILIIFGLVSPKKFILHIIIFVISFTCSVFYPYIVHQTI